MLSNSTLTSSPVATPPVGASATVALRFSKAKLPSSCTKPNKSSSRKPLARSVSPSAPSISKLRLVPVPVSTDRSVAPSL